MRLFQYISIAFIAVLLGYYVYQSSPHYQIIKGDIFGTVYKVKIRTEIKNKKLEPKIEAKLNEINKEMSVFEDSSELSNINRTQKMTRIKLSPDMRTVLKAAQQVYNQSNGAFDPTLAPVIDLWGFGPNRTQDIPEDKTLTKIMKTVGFDKLKFYNDFHEVSKTNSQTSLNLSAIAKGFAVDEIAKLLDAEGYTDYLVEIGGEIKAKGSRSPLEDPWTIGINKPIANSMENMIVLSLSNLAVATSGNYRNFQEKDGKIFAHTISSKTGKPSQTDILSVSVFHDSCMLADAYATAMMAMTYDQAKTFADKYHLKVFIVNKDFNADFSSEAKGLLSEQ